MVYSQFPEATPGCKRGRLFLSVNSACHLAESGFFSNESNDQLNRLTGVIPYELIKGKLLFKAVAKSEHKAGDTCQADLCITFEKDLYLSDIFQNLKDDDVQSYFIGKSSRIAAMGIIVNGDRELFPIAAEKARNFFKEVANTPDLAKNIINSSVPTFLLQIPMATIYSSVKRIMEGQSKMSSQIHQILERQEQMKIEMKEQMEELVYGQEWQMQELRLCIRELVN